MTIRPKSLLREGQHALPVGRRPRIVASAAIDETTHGPNVRCLALQREEGRVRRPPFPLSEELQGRGEAREIPAAFRIHFIVTAQHLVYRHALLLAREAITAERPRHDALDVFEHAVGGEELRAELLVERLDAIGGVDDVADRARLEVVERADFAQDQLAAMQADTRREGRLAGAAAEFIRRRAACASRITGMCAEEP